MECGGSKNGYHEFEDIADNLTKIKERMGKVM
jgi:hypothetical protein